MVMEESRLAKQSSPCTFTPLSSLSTCPSVCLSLMGYVCRDGMVMRCGLRGMVME